MATIHKDTISFLKAVKKNNNRDWFHDNKKQYDEIKEGFVVFMDALIGEISKF